MCQMASALRARFGLDARRTEHRGRMGGSSHQLLTIDELFGLIALFVVDFD